MHQAGSIHALGKKSPAISPYLKVVTAVVPYLDIASFGSGKRECDGEEAPSEEKEITKGSIWSLLPWPQGRA